MKPEIEAWHQELTQAGMSVEDMHREMCRRADEAGIDYYKDEAGRPAHWPIPEEGTYPQVRLKPLGKLAPGDAKTEDETPKPKPPPCVYHVVNVFCGLEPPHPKYF